MYTVTAPLIQVATTAGVAVQVTKGGPVPSNITDEALANLIDLGYVEGDADSDSKSNKVDEVLAEVGEDKEKAQAALDAEIEARGDKARKTLVEPLEKILAG